MPDFRVRGLSLVPGPAAVIGEQVPVSLAGEPGLADVVTFGRQQRAAQTPLDDEEERFFADALAEYQWARDVAGLAPSTLERLTRPVIEVCEHFGLVPWRAPLGGWFVARRWLILFVLQQNLSLIIYRYRPRAIV